MSDPNAERNDMAVVLSEELDFLEALLADFDLTPEAVSATLARRDVVRDAIATSSDASPDDEAEEGTPLPEDAIDDTPVEPTD